MKNIDRKAGEGSSSSSNKSVWSTGSPDDTLSMSVEEMTDAKDPHAADGYIKAANANPETPSFGDAAHNKQDKHGLHRKVIAGMLVAALASGVGVAAKGMAEQKTVDNGNQPTATQVEQDEEKIKEYYTSYEDEKGTTTSHWFVGPDGKETRGMSSFLPRPEGAEYDGSITGSRTDIFENGEGRKKSFTMNSSEQVEKAKEKADSKSEKDDERVVEYTTYGRNGNGTTTSHWEVGPDGKETRGSSSHTPRPEGAEYDGSITGSRIDILEDGEQRKKSFTMNSSERMEKAKERKDLSATEKKAGADDEVEAVVAD